MEERLCEYRNCKKDISQKRPNAKYCNRNCKSCERKYKSRHKAFIEKCKENEMMKVNLIKKIKAVEEMKNILKGGQPS